MWNIFINWTAYQVIRNFKKWYDYISVRRWQIAKITSGVSLFFVQKIQVYIAWQWSEVPGSYLNVGVFVKDGTPLPYSEIIKIHVCMYVNLYLYTENHQLSLS